MRHVFQTARPAPPSSQAACCSSGVDSLPEERGRSVRPSSTTTVYSHCFPRSATGVEYCVSRLLDVGTLLCVFQRSEHFLEKLRVTPPRCVTVVISNRPRVLSPLSSLQPRAANIRCYGSLSWLISDINYICRTWFLQEEIASFLPITPHCAMPLKFIRAHMNSGNLFTLFPI